MTADELWELFPVILSEHKEYWNDWYVEEEKRIKALLTIENARFSHIGSLLDSVSGDVEYLVEENNPAIISIRSVDSICLIGKYGISRFMSCLFILIIGMICIR